MRAWPAWKRIMHTSVAALFRWHPDKLTAIETTEDLATGQVSRRRVSLTYAQSCAAWQAGFKIGFEAGAGYRKRKS